tara:strand:+ start:343 stop:453 length:111 start_codon:yes stop_codon:yes gene_type:complete
MEAITEATLILSILYIGLGILLGVIIYKAIKPFIVK